MSESPTSTTSPPPDPPPVDERSSHQPPPPPAPPQHHVTAPLRRTRDDRVIAGVCGGIARSLNVDPVLVRIGFVVLTLAGGSGILAYVIGWIVIPEERPGEHAATGEGRHVHDSAAMRIAAGLFLVLLGGVWLIDRVFPGLSEITWPVALIAVGLAVLFAGARR